MAYYRQSQKGTTYYSKDFNGEEHPFKPECVAVLGQQGERRIDSIAFQSPQGNYVLGNDIDKLLSGAKIIYDKDGKMEKILENLWLNITKKLIEHRRKHNQKIDPGNEDLSPLLFRYERFSDDIKQDIKFKTSHYLIQNLKREKEKYFEDNSEKKTLKSTIEAKSTLSISKISKIRFKLKGIAD